MFSYEGNLLYLESQEETLEKIHILNIEDPENQESKDIGNSKHFAFIWSKQRINKNRKAEEAEKPIW